MNKKYDRKAVSMIENLANILRTKTLFEDNNLNNLIENVIVLSEKAHQKSTPLGGQIFEKLKIVAPNKANNEFFNLKYGIDGHYEFFNLKNGIDEQLAYISVSLKTFDLRVEVDLDSVTTDKLILVDPSGMKEILNEAVNAYSFSDILFSFGKINRKSKEKLKEELISAVSELLMAYIDQFIYKLDVSLYSDDDKEVRLRLYKKFFEERKVTFQPHSAEMLKGDFSGLHKLVPKYLGNNNTGTYLSDVINKGFVTDYEFENFIYTLEEIKDVDFSDSEDVRERAVNLVYTYSLAAISTEGNRKLSMYEVPLFIKFPEMFGIILNNVVSFIDKTGKEIPGINSDKMEYNVRLNISLLLGNYDRKISFLDGFGLGSLKIIRKCITVPNTKVSLSNNSCSIDSITNTLFQILKDKEFSEALKASGEKLDVPDGTKALLIGVRDFYGLQDKLPDSILNSHLREVDKQLFKDKDNFLFSPKRTFVRIYKK